MSTRQFFRRCSRNAEASEIFKRHGIDFCCGRDQLLTDAVAENGVDQVLLLDELNQCFTVTKLKGVQIIDWSTVPKEELVHHAEHHHTEDFVKELRQVTNNYMLPEDACGTFTSVRVRRTAKSGV
ncbi:DUF542 domain-containing protein [Alicyclobacillus mengziensis]|uniref:DUF542 domain-containing protein n=1 Tax=Alicyclobacillus mengziensis TaxID=2931921 RepID=UPI002011BE70|nr:DUF542 domain-containing protein [Alicyclobacillus mengziensis]